MKTLIQAEQEGVAFAKSAGVASIAELRRMAPGDLPRGRGWPIVDGWVIPDDQYSFTKRAGTTTWTSSSATTPTKA